MRTDLKDRLVDIARFHIGITENGGENRGQMVERFQKSVDGLATGEPWCMDFVQFLLGLVAEVHAYSSKVYRSESCLAVWNNTPPAMRVVVPIPGCIVIWQHKGTTAGHCGIVSSIEGDFFNTVEGNTGNGEGIVREGDGVYLRKRSLHPTGNMKLLGFIDPYYV